MLMVALKRQSRIEPVLFPFCIVPHICIAQRRQFTGGVFRSVSGSTAAINHDLRIFVRQDLWSKRRDTFRWQVYCFG
jgi:hypothetical protein